VARQGTAAYRDGRAAKAGHSPAMYGFVVAKCGYGLPGLAMAKCGYGLPGLAMAKCRYGGPVGSVQPGFF